MKDNLSFNIVANAVWGPEGLSGGDAIFIEIARFLVKRGVEVNIFTWEDGIELCQNNHLTGVNFHLISARKYPKFGFYPLYIMRTIMGIKKIKEVLTLQKIANKKVIIYSASDFWPDSMPAIFYKNRLRKSKWIAGFYLFSPRNLRNLPFLLSQKIIFWLVAKYADLICVTSQPDISPFVQAGRKTDEIFVMRGGIDYEHLKKFQRPIEKIYDAVFVGRFHPQKGVLEMIDIWREVVKRRPRAKLALIGTGSLEKEMKKNIVKYSLDENVNFFGPLIGDDRNIILQQSRIVLHPAVYDSGGMAAASGLACGLPGVCFDLSVLKTYYPRGFLYAKIGNISDFADKVISLLKKPKLYEKLSREAVNEARGWDWEKRITLFTNKLSGLWKSNGKS